MYDSYCQLMVKTYLLLAKMICQALEGACQLFLEIFKTLKECCHEFYKVPNVDSPTLCSRTPITA